MENKDILDQQIECAIREKGAINHFKDLEAQSRGETSNHISAYAEKSKKTFWKPGQYAGRWGFAASLAAVLCVGGVGIKESMDARSALDAYLEQDNCNYIVRGGDTSWDMKSMEQKQTELERQMEHPLYTEPEYMEQLAVEKQTLEFNKALNFMSKGRFISARKLLKTISAGEGIYSDDASKLLKDM